MRILLGFWFVWLAGSAAWATDWPQLQADAQHTGRTRDEVRQLPQGQGHGQSRWRLHWAWSGPGLITRGEAPLPKHPTASVNGLVQPIVVAGRAIFGCLDGSVQALDLENGKECWRFQAGGPIANTAAYAAGTVIVASTDAKIYGIDITTGRQRWTFPTGAALTTAPSVHDGIAYVAGRDGCVYAIDAGVGRLRWKIDLGAPIQNSPAVGLGKVFVGSEDMVFHALEERTGKELWRHPVMGQSMWRYFPVVDEQHGLVTFFTMCVVAGAENMCDPKMEELLTRLPEHDWPAERQALLKYLTKEAPERRNFYVLRADTGDEPYIVPAGLTAGNNDVPMPPVIDHQGRLLIYWRTKSGRFVGGTFGTKWPPDIGPVDPRTGDRVKLDLPPTHQPLELDNNFFLTVGGDCLYGANHFRGGWYMDLRPGTGQCVGVSRPYRLDRDGGYPLAEGSFSLRGDRASGVPPSPGSNGWSGIVPVGKYLVKNEPSARCIAVYEGVGKEVP